MKSRIFIFFIFLLICACVFGGFKFVIKSKKPSYTSDEKNSSLNKTSITFPQNTIGTQYGPESKYTVKSGDSIALIASKYGVSSENIIKINKLANPDALTENTELTLPQYDDSIKKNIVKYQNGTRNITNSSMENEAKSFYEIFFTEPIIQTTIIYSNSDKACVEIKITNTKKYIYLAKYNNDWQAYAMEI